ncbi:hypothetical protein HNR77_004472 [Paenibacillus sp. JGP012]|nr:hypothetical protein [Paenibacillus sp. JGP012]
MLKIIRLGILFLGVVAVTSGCGGLSNKEKNTYYQKALPIGQEYFKKYYNVEVEFTEFYINIPMSSIILLKGHLENDPYTKVSLYYDFTSLKVKSESGPEDFIKKRKSEEEINSQ